MNFPPCVLAALLLLEASRALAASPVEAAVLRAVREAAPCMLGDYYPLTNR